MTKRAKFPISEALLSSLTILLILAWAVMG